MAQVVETVFFEFLGSFITGKFEALAVGWFFCVHTPTISISDLHASFSGGEQTLGRESRSFSTRTWMINIAGPLKVN